MTRAIARFFSEKPEYERRMAVLKRAADKTPFTFRDVTNARALFGERMQISPSRLETFRQCRFLYYCRYGLRAFPRGRAEMDAPEIGTLIHFVLERLLREHSGEGLWTIARDELSSQVKSLLKEFADGFLGGLKDKPERFKYLYLRLEGQVIGLIEHIARELEQSMFRPVDFELTIGRDVKPLTVDLPDGGSITVEGKVDRVDLMKRDGASYLRVVDYKTGSKEFNLSDVIYGLNLQMFLYLFALCDNGGGRYSAQGEITPAGVLYVPSGRPNITAARSAGEEDISAARDSAYKMSGLLLDDPEVIRAMERDGSGVFIPAKLRKSEDADGNVSYEPDSRASVASLEKFGFLKRHVVKTLKDMALTLHEGDVAAEPVQGISYHPCDYCDYACVCGHEPGDGIRLLRKYDKEEVWKSLKEEGGVENG
ncbi:MAG TPA: PD-(D/E)XK nuclease family protein, partial [Clostridia bacterium]|nr:PD-(D/E)XK nuclease family protein [Clostridia bacterium]